MAEERTIREFHAAQKSTFYYFDQWKEHTSVACDETGTGSLGTFTIPGKSGSDFAVYDNGNLVAWAGDYVIDRAPAPTARIASCSTAAPNRPTAIS